LIAAGVEIDATTAAIGGDQQSAVSDREGRFVLGGLVAARYAITATKGPLRTELSNVDATRETELKISLDARDTGIVSGRVNGLSATGVRGPLVRSVVTFHGQGEEQETPIDDAGRYRFQNVPAGSAELTARVSSQYGHRSSKTVHVRVPPGEEIVADLDIAPALTVTGHVTSANGPVPGALVLFAGPAGELTSTTAGDDGAYEAGLPTAGAYRVIAHASVSPVRFQSLRALRGGETIDIDFTERTIAGTVVDALTQQPLAGALVSVVADERSAGETIAEGTTDASGTYRISLAGAGAHRVIASAPGHAQRSERVVLDRAQAMRIEFALPSATPLRVRVADTRTDIPLDGWVTIAAPDGVLPVRPERSADGEWWIFSVAPGEYRVTAVVPGYTTRTTRVTAPGDTTVKM
jgi:hypothetical protein